MTSITGTVKKIDQHPHLVLVRRFDDVTPAGLWRELTDSALLERWIGRWEGDPATGRVAFFMTAEGENVPAEEYRILECDAPRRFVGETASGWHLWFEIDASEGITVLTFGQRLDLGQDVGSIGPGWEYYLDRLVAAHEGGDVAGIDWETYFPAQQPDYERLVAAD